MKSLIHAAVVVLTILLFLIKPPSALAAVCYKRPSPGYKYNSENLKKTPPLRESMDACDAQGYYVPPKYKRDPEIDVDNEEIGQYPLV